MFGCCWACVICSLSLPPVELLQSDGGIKRRDVTDGSLLIPVGQTAQNRTTSSAAVIFAVTVPAGPSGKPVTLNCPPHRPGESLPCPCRLHCTMPPDDGMHGAAHCAPLLDHALVSRVADTVPSGPPKTLPRGAGIMAACLFLQTIWVSRKSRSNEGLPSGRQHQQ